MGNIEIGIDSYSYHRYFGEVTPWEQALDIRWETTDFLARVHQLGVQAVSLQTAYLPELTDTVVKSLRDQLDALSIKPTLAWGHPNGLEGGFNPQKVESLRRLLPFANALGCSIVRLVCGNQFTWTIPAVERIERLKPILKQLVQEASGLDLTLAIENHADFTMKDLVTLVEGVGENRLGICFDTGNAVRVGDELLLAAEIAVPWIKMVHLKDLVVHEDSRSDPAKWWPSAPLGRGHFDLVAFIQILRAGGYAGHLFIEMANMYTDWPDEDEAVAESVDYLKRLLDKSQPITT